MIISAVNPSTVPSSATPTEGNAGAADQLAKAFFIDALKQSGLDDAFASPGQDSLNLGFVALEALADQMVSQSPRLVEAFRANLWAENRE